MTKWQSAKSAFGDDVLKEDDYKRKDFIAPRSRKLDLRLRVVVIKHPTAAEIKFLQTSLGQNYISSKLIFDERIKLSSEQTLKTLKGESGVVLGTQNRMVVKNAIENLSLKAAASFKDMILYAF